MYPQSLQTHSPAQYLSSSSGFCSLVFRFPKTFKLVLDDVTEGAIPTDEEGRTGANAWDDPVRQMSAKINEIRNDFMMINNNRRRVY